MTTAAAPAISPELEAKLSNAFENLTLRSPLQIMRWEPRTVTFTSPLTDGTELYKTYGADKDYTEPITVEYFVPVLARDAYDYYDSKTGAQGESLVLVLNQIADGGPQHEASRVGDGTPGQWVNPEELGVTIALYNNFGDEKLERYVAHLKGLKGADEFLSHMDGVQN